MKLCQLNCQGLMRTFSFLEQMMLAEWKADIVCLCGTWLEPNSTTNRFLGVSHYLFFRRDRQLGFHGGLLVYENPRLCPNRRFDLEAAGSEEEFVALDLKIPSLGNCLPFHCYRSPSFSPRTFFSQLSHALEKASTCTWFIVGDFNACRYAMGSWYNKHCRHTDGEILARS